MPTLNVVNCYTVPLQNIAEKFKPTDLNQLPDILYRILVNDANRPSVSDIKKDLEAHIGEMSTYKCKEPLISSLTVVNNALNSDQIPDSHKISIAFKILEDLNKCTPGFHNRILSIELGLVRPNTIEDLLFTLRMSIVEITAVQHTQDIHVYNAYYNAATALGYGTRPLNKDDIYAPLLTKKKHKQIHRAFAEKYSPFAIIIHLCLAIKSELALVYKYKGPKKFDYKPGKSGYKSGKYEGFKLLLDKLLGPNSYEDLFISEEYEDVFNFVDIDWRKVQWLIIKKLEQSFILTFSEEEILLFRTLFYDSTPEDYSTINLSLIEKMRLVTVPIIFDCLSEEFLTKLEEKLREDWKTTPENAFSQLLIQEYYFQRIGASIKHQPSLVFLNKYQEILSTLLRNKKNFYKLKIHMATYWKIFSESQLQILFLPLFQYAVVKKHALIKVLITQLSTLSIDTQTAILSTKDENLDTMLTLSAHYNSTTLLWNYIKKFSVDTQFNFLTHQNKDNCNILIIIAKNYSNYFIYYLNDLMFLTYDQKKQLFSVKNEDGLTAFDIMDQKDSRWIINFLSKMKSNPRGTYESRIQIEQLLLLRTTNLNQVYIVDLILREPEILKEILHYSIMSTSDFIKILSIKYQNDDTLFHLAARENLQSFFHLLKKTHNWWNSPVPQLHLKNKLGKSPLDIIFQDTTWLDPFFQYSLATQSKYMRAWLVRVVLFSVGTEDCRFFTVMAHNFEEFKLYLEKFEKLNAKLQSRIMHYSHYGSSDIRVLSGPQIWRPMALETLMSHNYSTTMLAAKGEAPIFQCLINYMLKNMNQENFIAPLLWTNRHEHNTLIIAARYNLSNFLLILKTIEQFSESSIEKLLFHKNKFNYSAIQVAVKSHPHCSKDILKTIKKHPWSLQKRIIALINKKDLDINDYSEFSLVQHYYLNDTLDRQQSNHFYSRLSVCIHRLDEQDAIEANLKKRLSNQSINQTLKQCAILDEYYNICSYGVNIRQNFDKAMKDINCPFYKALNIIRYPSLNPLTSFFGTNTLIAMQSVPRNANPDNPRRRLN